MENRKRNIRLRFNLTDREKELFERKKEESGAKSMSHFIRKTVLKKEIYEVDLEPLRDLYGTLSIVTNKLNQIAKRVNQTGVIYKSDIDDRINLSIISQKKCMTYIHYCWKGRSDLLDTKIKCF